MSKHTHLDTHSFDSVVFHHLNKPAALLFIWLKSDEFWQQLTLPLFLPLFFLIFTCRLPSLSEHSDTATCQNFPLRGMQLWSCCLHRFYTGNSFPETECGDFWISLSLYFFVFLQGTKPLLKEWMQWGRLITALLPLVAKFHTTLPANTQSLNRINAQECVISSSCCGSHLSDKRFYALFFSTSITLHKRRWKALRSCHSLLLDFTSICISDNEGQKAVGSIWNMINWSD